MDAFVLDYLPPCCCFISRVILLTPSLPFPLPPLLVITVVRGALRGGLGGRDSPVLVVVSGTTTNY